MSAAHGVSPARLDAIAAGAVPSPEEARAILADPASRAALAARDASALFALLGALPLDPPAPAYVSPAAPPKRVRALLAAAAALVAAAGLLVAVRVPGPPASPGAPLLRAEAILPPAGPGGAATSWPAPVERVGSPTAEVVTLVPPSEGGAVVTMIVDEGVEL